mmetsp:Transcript_14398/g.39812  ORF Transcript_14398/g.39812 Transcript_14398/m.39812 type:complete len:262 (-) Transcript_14398:41-826(-)
MVAISWIALPSAWLRARACCFSLMVLQSFGSLQSSHRLRSTAPSAFARAWPRSCCAPTAAWPTGPPGSHSPTASSWRPAMPSAAVWWTSRGAMRPSARVAPRTWSRRPSAVSAWSTCHAPGRAAPRSGPWSRAAKRSAPAAARATWWTAGPSWRLLCPRSVLPWPTVVPRWSWRWSRRRCRRRSTSARPPHGCCMSLEERVLKKPPWIWCLVSNGCWTGAPAAACASRSTGRWSSLATAARPRACTPTSSTGSNSATCSTA